MDKAALLLGACSAFRKGCNPPAAPSISLGGTNHNMDMWMQVVQLEVTAVVASLLPGLLTYYPVDQFAVAPPLPGTPPGAGLVVEAWAPNKLRAGSPPFAAPQWHLPSEPEVRAAVGFRVLTLRPPGQPALRRAAVAPAH